MQKKLIALAVAGLVSGGAFAQSSVTIYGVADATFDNVRATGAAGGAAAEFKARNRVTANSSYIGFKGTEDLGSGLKAVFQFENGLTTDNGAAGVWNNRDSYVGLAGGFGTLLGGNVTGPTRGLGAKFEINSGATGIGANTALIGKLGGGSGAGAFDQRINNAVAYVTPAVSGFQGTLGYSSGLTNSYNGAALAGRESSGKGTAALGNTAWTLGVNYDNGPLYLAYAYTSVDASVNGATAADGLLGAYKKVSDNRAGAMYKFSAGQIGFLWDRPSAQPVGASNKVTQNVYYISGKYMVSPVGTIIAQYGHAANLTNVAVTADTGASHIVVGFEYALSKRTVLKALYSKIDNKANASYDYLYGVSNANSTATADALGKGNDPAGVSFGVRHSF